MTIDDSIIKSYLKDKDDYKNHWLFNSILDNGEYVFDNPNNIFKDKVNIISKNAYKQLMNFTPYNVSIFNELFPNWKDLMNNINIIFAVGCPSPYDAMVRNHEETEYIIFDLIRFISYEEKGYDVSEIISDMITHEFVHICLHFKYPAIEDNYESKLSYIAFDEGFAHLLSFSNNISLYDFSEQIKSHYLDSINMLKLSIEENNKLKQKEYLEKSNSGPYWSKFAAISGMLYLTSNIKDLYSIYENGPSTFISNIVSNEL